MPLIAIDQVTKRFGGHEVLKGIDLNIGAGEVISLIGRSGSGKSTLLRCINGLESIDGGRIDVAGAPLSDDAAALKQLRLQVGMISQQFNLFPHLSIGRNVMLAPMIVLGMKPAEARRQAGLQLERVGLSDKFDAYPDQLSGGQQQRVAIARALCMSPKALLCDEITSALDPELVQEVLAVMKQLAAGGMTLVMVTHEMRFAREVCDRVVFLHQGRIHESGTPNVLFNQPRTDELRQFLAAAHDA
ncbi:amino acid ABC transporter ATP-binding protein [Caballeronia sp. LZ034LL]|uniref:amino acid ABC transporter ATP-binding protein n=1 Tax=Caballeronia sp. LZ034LL TaxID=3038567 RepID=UPI002864A180|nr:amino acid ABC transporter ATP-binding protein [Caballeronia sp. LZ034LL]MDR5836296.1 amino acid ABC transporter ATP-binding protein [Caballeronia sp. LZ034LL]